MNKKIKRRSDCPISFALDIFGDKWSLLIIRDLMFKGKVTYGEFIDSEEGIATNILADRLQVLEAARVIDKNDSGKKSKYTYSLTEKGKALLPILLEIIRWSAKYDPRTAAPREFVRRLTLDKEKLTNEILKQLKLNPGIIY